MLAGKPMAMWIDQYERSHQHPTNRTLHMIGIPLIAGSLPLALLALIARRSLRLPLALFGLGWIFQFSGHALEGKPPEFFHDRTYLLVGLRWWLAQVRDRI